MAEECREDTAVEDMTKEDMQKDSAVSRRQMLQTAAESGLLYLWFVWKNVSCTTFFGSMVGVLPLAVCLQLSAESLVSEPRGGRLVSMFPDQWTHQDAEMVARPTYVSFWLLKNFWCAIAEYVPVWLALQGDARGAHRGSGVLAVAAVCLVVILETASVSVWSLKLNFCDHNDFLITIIKYSLMILINAGSIILCEASHLRPVALLAICGITLLSPFLHIIQEVCIDIYLDKQVWYVHALLVFGVMNVVRPLLVEYVLLVTSCTRCLLSSESRAFLTAYVSISCTALAHLLQVANRGFLETFLTYCLMMGSEIMRNQSYLLGQTECQSLLTRLRWIMKICTGCREVKVVEAILVVPRMPSAPAGTQSSQHDASDVDGIEELPDSIIHVTGDIVAISNILEGSLIVWISLLLIIVHLNPYEVGGYPLPRQTTLTNCAMALFIEAISDFGTYLLAAYRDPAMENERLQCRRRVGIGSDTKLKFLGLVIVVVSLSMEAAGHLFESLCPTPEPGHLHLRALSQCPEVL